MRIIAGSAKGRKLLSVPGAGTRPITARVKTALFSILGADIREAHFLDLFAGTGGVGIEALSRGAAHAVFVERSRKALMTVRRNLEITGLMDRAEVIHGDAFRYVNTAPPEARYDYIYVAPPQYQALWAKMVLALDAKPLLAPDGLVIVQIHPKEADELPTRHLALFQERHYGSTLLRFYSWRASRVAEEEEQDVEGEEER